MATALDRALALLGVKKRDPVCGMYIRPSQAAATSQHQGRAIYFCGVGCKQSFDAEPERYS